MELSGRRAVIQCFFGCNRIANGGGSFATAFLKLTDGARQGRAITDRGVCRHLPSSQVIESRTMLNLCPAGVIPIPSLEGESHHRDVEDRVAGPNLDAAVLDKTGSE